MEKVYVIVGICEGSDEPSFLSMGQQKVYKQLDDAKAELNRILQEIKDNKYDYGAVWNTEGTALSVHFNNSYDEDYYIYEMELV